MASCESGAIDYIVKPFSFELLAAKVTAIIEASEKMQSSVPDSPSTRSLLQLYANMTATDR